MVSPRLRRARRILRALPVLIALAGPVVLAGCRGRADASGGTGTPEERAAYAVKGQYTAPDVIANAAWTWTAPDSVVFVVVDVESAIEGVVQATVDLWSVADGAPQRFARSELLPSVASLSALVFEDLTGDGIPDFLGTVADSAGVEYPVFFPGARANLTEEIQMAGSGYHFSTDEQTPPAVLRGLSGMACAVQLWADGSVPDSLPAGWRFLALLRNGALDKPMPLAPPCGPPGGGTAPDSGSGAQPG